MTVHRMPIDRIRSERIHQGLAYWLSIRQGETLPTRAEFSPAHIPRLLPHVILSEVHHDPLRIRYRLVGTRITEVEGCDMTGLWIESDAPADDLEDWYEDYRIVVETKQPLFGRDDILYPEGSTVSYEWGLLPLTKDADGQQVDLILEVIVFDNEPELIHRPLIERKNSRAAT